MEVEILLSCMNQEDQKLINQSNLNNEKVLMVNQIQNCNDSLITINPLHKIINSNTKGLSVSRNIALEYASGDICVICDDDEVFIDNLGKKISDIYVNIPSADIIVFDMINHKSKFKSMKKLTRLELLKVASWQITFRRKSIKNIRFDDLIGTGTQNGGGEENKFLLDCHQAGLEIYYYPLKIATVAQNESTWFFGFDSNYFYNRGKATRYILGFNLSVLYALYFLCTKYKYYKESIDIQNAFYSLMSGIFRNELGNNNASK